MTGVICCGDAKPDDRCFADIVATDDAELLAFIAHRRRWRFWYRLGDPIALPFKLRLLRQLASS
jgi:hypothetical protein